MTTETSYIAIAKPDRPIKKLKNTPSNFTLKMKF